MVITDKAFFATPPVRYLGAKWQLAEWIIDRMPAHDHYVEPFCGGAAVFFRKSPSPLETLNDLNGDVVNFFKVLRERTDDLVFAIEMTPLARAEYDLSWSATDDPLERARRFYIRAVQAFSGGGVRRKTGWRHMKTFARGTSVAADWIRIDGLLAAAARLKNAQIECANALKVIKDYDSPKTLFYVDPPYVHDVRSGKTDYVHEMNADEHRDLASVLHEVRGMVMLSGYQSDLYEELYAGWTVMTKTSTTNGNSASVECLWVSPNVSDPHSSPLFARHP